MSDPIVVIDKGSARIKMGICGNAEPTVYPACLGKPLLRASERATASDVTIKDLMIGQEVIDNRSLLDVTYPIKHGLVQDWDALETLYRHGLNDLLHVNPATSTTNRALFAFNPLVPHNQIESEMTMLFEKFGFSQVAIHDAPILVLYSIGKTEGMVLEVGDGVTALFPVFSSTILQSGIRRVNIGGSDVTESLIKLLGRRGYAFNRSSDYDTVRQLKETFCFAAADPKAAHKLARETTTLERTYRLPDGQTVMAVGSERFEAVETLLRPSLAGHDIDSLADLYWDSVQACPIDTRMLLFGNTVLSGGSSLFPGMSTRLRRDVTKLFVQNGLKGDASRLETSSWRMGIVDAPTRGTGVWQGGSSYGDLIRDDVAYWVTKQDYEELGVTVRCTALRDPSR